VVTWLTISLLKICSSDLISIIKIVIKFFFLSNDLQSTSTRAHLEFDWSLIESLLFFIITFSSNYNYIFNTIKICNKNYIYINLKEQSQYKNLINVKVWLNIWNFIRKRNCQFKEREREREIVKKKIALIVFFYCTPTRLSKKKNASQKLIWTLHGLKKKKLTD
jgi:hypothetical protein